MSTARDLLDQALALDPKQRAEIAAELLDSLEPPNTWTEAEGMAEIERRARRVLENGPRDATWPDVRAQIEQELKV